MNQIGWAILAFILAVLLDLYYIRTRRRNRIQKDNPEVVDYSRDSSKLKWMVERIEGVIFLPQLSDRSSIFKKFLGCILSILLISIGIGMLRVGEFKVGLLALTIGVVLFLAGNYFLQKSSAKENRVDGIESFQRSENGIKSYPIFIGCWVSALVLFIWVIYQMTLADPHGKFIPNWFLWPVSLILLVIGSLAPGNRAQISRKTARKWWKANKREIIIVSIILVVGFAIRILYIDVHPYPWSGDEAAVGIDGRNILSGNVSEMFATGWSGQPYWSFVPTSLSIAIFGENIIAIRMVSVLVGTLTILTLYLFCRELFSLKIATIAAIFLTAFPYHVHFSRIGVSNIFDGLNVTLALWLTYRAIKKGQLSDYVFAGLVTGFSFYTYVGSRLVILMVLGVFIYAIITERSYFRTQWVKICAFGFACMLTIGPVGYYFSQYPDKFMTRIGQEGILLNNWLMHEVMSTNSSILSVLLEQFSKSTMVFIVDEAWTLFFYSTEPYLSLLGSTFFMIGMAYAFLRLKELRNIILLGWFWSVVIFGSTLTTNPPSSTRMLMTSPAIAVFLAVGIDQVGKAFGHLYMYPKWINALTGIVLGVLLLQGFDFYFGEYRTGHYFRDGNSELAMEAGLQLSQMNLDSQYYLFGSPRIFAEFPTTVFIAPHQPKTDLSTDMIDEFVVPDQRVSFFVAIPENKADLERIRNRFPGGEWETFYRKTADEVLYYSYTFSP